MTGSGLRDARERRLAAPPSLRELALEEIRLAITTGLLDEGRTYSAAGLAKELGMSLSPVREAMMSLVSEGTVEAVPNRGFRLRHVSLDDLEDIIRIRVILSMPAVEDLCRRARASSEGSEGQEGAEGAEGAEGIARIEAELDELDRLATEGSAAVAAGAPEEFLRLDREFHRSLLRFGLGARAAEVSLRLRDQSRLVDGGRSVALADPQTAAELVEIVRLLRAGRTEEARRAVRDNLHCYERVLGVAGSAR